MSVDDVESYPYPEGYELEGYELEGEGSLDQVEGNETAVLFGRLGDELQMLVQRYSVPPTDLEDLFQVVQNMFELMDADQVALSQANAERQEIEALWKEEKDKRKNTQRVKLDLECRLEDEQLRGESERVTLEKDKALLQTRVKQLQEHNCSAESDLHRLKDKMSQNEEARKGLLEEYKKQADVAKNMTLRRKNNTGTLKRRNQPIAPKTTPSGWGQDARFSASLNVTPHSTGTRSENFLESGEVPAVPFPHDLEDEEEASRLPRPHPLPQRLLSPLSAPPRSLAEELEKEEQKNSTGQHMNGFQSEKKRAPSLEGVVVGGASEEEEEEWFAEDSSFFEEMLGVDPLMRTEVEMLQKEKDTWKSDQMQLEQEKRELREQKEGFERQNNQLQVELKRLLESHGDLQEKLADVKKERDEILDNYLEQPFDEYCITRKELHQLLMKQQMTALELEKAREEKLQLQKELESRRTIFERLKERWRKVFSAKAAQASAAAAAAAAEEERTHKTSKRRTPLLLPVARDISSILKDGNFAVKKEWLVSRDCQVHLGNLPHWVGQITLKGVETERIECSVVARVFHSPIGQLPPNYRALQPRNPLALWSSMHQLHAEVWVATVEASLTRIEVIDVIARPPKVRQRFIIKPKTAHIVCMKSIPGRIEESSDFIDSAILSQETEWMDCSFVSPNRRSSSYLGPRVSFKDRPHSAPRERLARNIMASTPNLSSLSSASDPGPLNPELFESYSPETRPRHRKLKTTHDTLQPDNMDTSSTCSLTTINEDSALYEGLSTTHSQQEVSKETVAMQNGSVPKETVAMQNGSVPKETVATQNGGVPKETVATQNGSVPKETVATQNGSVSKEIVAMQDAMQDVKDGSGTKETVAKETVAMQDISEDFVEISLLPPEETSTPAEQRRAVLRERKFSVSGRLSFVQEPRDDEVDYDCSDGGDTANEQSPPIMWIVTEDDNLLFYPTTDPSHRPINRVKLQQRAVCLEYMKGVVGSGLPPRVFIGHVNSTISIYHMDEFQSNVWDVENPERITLPCANPDERHEVKCIASVGDRIWAGAGPSIFFINAENPSMREGSIFLDNYRRRPEVILPVGDLVVVSTKGSVFYVFDSQSAHVVQKFDVSPITHHLDHPIPLDLRPGSPRLISAPTDIKTMVTDGDLLYLGTSNGKVVTVPISALKRGAMEHQFVQSQIVEEQLEAVVIAKTSKKDSKPSKDDKASKRDRHSKESAKEREAREEKVSKALEEKEKKGVTESRCLPFSAAAVHSHMDERVKALLFLKLPEMSLSKLKKAAETVHYHSLPNLASPYGGRIPISPPILGFRSLVISVGKGHVEYVQEKGEEPDAEDGSLEAHRERHEAFQLLLWGHKNVAS